MKARGRAPPMPLGLSSNTVVHSVLGGKRGKAALSNPPFDVKESKPGGATADGPPRISVGAAASAEKE